MTDNPSFEEEMGSCWLNQTRAIYPREGPKPKVCVTTTIAILPEMQIIR